MKIVDKAVKKVYRFNCPNCQSRLEGESKEFEDIGGKISKFFCPVCKKDRYITCRWKNKNGIQDLKKIMWYTQHLIDHLEKKEKIEEENN